MTAAAAAAAAAAVGVVVCVAAADVPPPPPPPPVVVVVVVVGVAAVVEAARSAVAAVDYVEVTYSHPTQIVWQQHEFNVDLLVSIGRGKQQIGHHVFQPFSFCMPFCAVAGDSFGMPRCSIYQFASRAYLEFDVICCSCIYTAAASINDAKVFGDKFLRMSW